MDEKKSLNDFKYFVLCVKRKKGDYVDKYYRRSREEIIALENQISSMYKNVVITKYRVRSYIDFENAITF